jgi:hypothetical protein
VERELDLTKYKPYKDHRGLCKFKSLKERKISWSTNEKYVLDGKYLLRPSRKDEIDEVVEIYRAGFPELYGNTNHGVVLWYDSLLKSENGFMKGNWFLYVAKKLDEKNLVLC